MVTRRAFLAGAGGAFALASSRRAQAATSTMRLGSVSWNFRGIGQGPPFDKTIRTVSELGFTGIELIVARAEELKTYWTESETARVRRLLARANLKCSQFVLFQHAVSGF